MTLCFNTFNLRRLKRNRWFSRNVAAILACASLAAACFRQDRRTIFIEVPQMRSPACYAVIQEALKGIEGIEYVRPHYDKRQLEVRYDALRLAIKNIEYVIAGAGFQANDIEPPAEARARLAEECR